MSDEPTKIDVDIIGGFPVATPNCKGCGRQLISSNAWMTDGCSCNTPLGVNSMNETRWRLLMGLQQRQANLLAGELIRNNELTSKLKAAKERAEKAESDAEVLKLIELAGISRMELGQTNGWHVYVGMFERYTNVKDFGQAVRKFCQEYGVMHEPESVASEPAGMVSPEVACPKHAPAVEIETDWTVKKEAPAAVASQNEATVSEKCAAECVAYFWPRDRKIASATWTTAVREVTAIVNRFMFNKSPSPAGDAAGESERKYWHIVGGSVFFDVDECWDVASVSEPSAVIARFLNATTAKEYAAYLNGDSPVHLALKQSAGNLQMYVTAAASVAIDLANLSDERDALKAELESTKDDYQLLRLRLTANLEPIQAGATDEDLLSEVSMLKTHLDCERKYIEQVADQHGLINFMPDRWRMMVCEFGRRMGEVDTIKVEVERLKLNQALPHKGAGPKELVPPTGFKHTGQYRAPLKGEGYFLDSGEFWITDHDQLDTPENYHAVYIAAHAPAPATKE